MTKVFRGDANFTIETMVTLTRALDGHLNLHITAKEEKVVNWLRVIRGGKKETVTNLLLGEILLRLKRSLAQKYLEG